MSWGDGEMGENVEQVTQALTPVDLVINSASVNQLLFARALNLKLINDSRMDWMIYGYWRNALARAQRN